MAKGLEKHRERQQQLSLLGKDLARRSGRKCELCHAAGESLTACEALYQPDPDLDSCLFLCARCREQLESQKNHDTNYLRCLNHSIWSDIPLVQATALYLLDKLDADWAEALAEQVYRYPELDELMAQIDKHLSR